MPWKKDFVQLSSSQFAALTIELDPGYPRKVKDILQEPGGRQTLFDHGIVEWEPYPKAPAFATITVTSEVDEDLIGRYTVTDTAYDEVARIAAACAYEREQRNKLLVESDITVLALNRAIRKAIRASNTDLADDLTGLRDQWDDYRELLCEVPEQPGFPDDITWPTAPAKTSELYQSNS